MDAATFLKEFEHLAEAPSGIARLRELVLGLAVTGRLIDPDVSFDGPAKAERLSALAPPKSGRSKSKSADLGIEPEELRWPVPESWGFVTILDVARAEHVFSDGDWVESRDQDPSGNIRLLQLADVGSGRFRDRSDRWMNRKTADRLQCTFLEPDDVLAARLPDPLGRACLFPGSSDPCVTVVDVCIIRANRDWYDPGFVVTVLNSPQLLGLSERFAAGTTRKRVSRGRLAAFPCPLPPLEEQKRIVAKVDELMALCDQLEEKQKKKREARIHLNKSCLDNLLAARDPDEFATHWRRVSENFDELAATPESVTRLGETVQSLVVQGRIDGAVLSETGAEAVKRAQGALVALVEEGRARKLRPVDDFVDGSALFPVPKGWSWARLGTIADLVSGVTKGRKLGGKKTVELPYLRVANVQRAYLELEKMKSIEVLPEDENKYALKAGDLLLTEGGDWDKLGRTAIWAGEVPRCIHQNHVFRARMAGDSVLPEWVMLFTNSLLGRAYFAEAAKQTTNLASINMTQLRNCPIPVPPTELQVRLVELARRLLAECKGLEDRVRQSETLAEQCTQATVHHLLAA